jgi:hypothetical protein
MSRSNRVSGGCIAGHGATERMTEGVNMDAEVVEDQEGFITPGQRSN